MDRIVFCSYDLVSDGYFSVLLKLEFLKAEKYRFMMSLEMEQTLKSCGPEHIKFLHSLLGLTPSKLPRNHQQIKIIWVNWLCGP